MADLASAPALDEALGGNYDRLFYPSSIAVVGASNNPAALGGWVYANLRKQFPGRLYAVNSARATVQGDAAVPNLGGLAEPVDLVVLITPAEQVPEQVLSCIERGDGSAVVMSSGFAEGGPAGARGQQRISELASTHNFPVLGPNCVGFLNGHAGVVATFALGREEQRPVPGPVALVSQSGGFGSFILNKAISANVQVGLFASTGNEANITVARLLRHFVESPDVSTLLTFCEAVRDPDLFVEAAVRAAELGKVIVALRTGDSEVAARAAMSHTASIVGSSEVFEAICDQYGVVSASSIEEMIDLATMLQSGRRMTGSRIGIVTASGGAGVLVADAASKVGLDVPTLPPADQEGIAEYIPIYGSAANPVDHTAQIHALPPDTFWNIISGVAASDVIDALLIISWRDEGVYADAIRELHRSQSKPVVPVITIGGGRLSAEGIPTYGDPTRAVNALAVLSSACARDAGVAPTDHVRGDPERVAHARAVLDGRDGHIVAESMAKRVLAQYGIPVASESLVESVELAVQAATAIAGPVAVKVLSPDLPHKSDSGLVRLGVEGDGAVRTAYRELLATVGREAPDAKVEGVLVQEMVAGTLELAAGLQRDPVFGPMVAIGLGGTLIEMLGSPVLLRPPFGIATAMAAVRRIAGGKIVQGVRGLNDEQVQSAAAVMVALGEVAVELPEVVSIDINPIRVSRKSFKAVDALMILDE